MATAVIDEHRLRRLNDCDTGRGGYVLYWMQAANRTRENHALEHAVRTANALTLPLVVGFGLDPEYPESEPSSMRFLVDGLVDVARSLERRNIGFVVRKGRPYEVAADLSEDAATVVVDRNYLREPRRWRADLADALDVAVIEVDTNVVVPVEVASDKREWAARTLRPKVHEHLEHFLVELRTTAVDVLRVPDLTGLEGTAVEPLLAAIGLSSEESMRFRGGERRAASMLRRFIDDGLAQYPDAGSMVEGSASSHLSMYLHYGHIAPGRVARSALDSGASQEAKDAFVEEVVVRRELAHNYVWFEPDYDRYQALPDWARKTLSDHRDDDRSHVYTKSELEQARTHDRYWNAAMIEMRETGYLHNRLRMYWGKRILDWTNTPEYAYRVALELNNRYLLDGRDPNSYANVGWLFGLHDQAFAEREVIGKVRPLTRAGLERKIEAEAYVALVEERTGRDIQ